MDEVDLTVYYLGNDAGIFALPFKGRPNPLKFDKVFGFPNAYSAVILKGSGCKDIKRPIPLYYSGVFHSQLGQVAPTF